MPLQITEKMGKQMIAPRGRDRGTNEEARGKPKKTGRTRRGGKKARKLGGHGAFRHEKGQNLAGGT